MADTLDNLVWECAVWNDWSVQEAGDLFFDFLARGTLPNGGQWRLKIATDWLEFRAKSVILPPSCSLDLLCGPMEGAPQRRSLRDLLRRAPADAAPQSRLTTYYLPGDESRGEKPAQIHVGELVLHDTTLSRAGWHLLAFDVDPYDAHHLFDRDCEEFLRLHLARDPETETEFSLNEDGLRLFLKAPIKSREDLQLAVRWGLKICENVR